MRNVVFIPFVLALACTKHNPEACCSTPDQCSMYGLGGITPCEGTGQVCDSTGTCVMPQCTVSTDCTDPTMPFCENQFCVAACGSDADCTGVAGKPFCGSAGACVACLDNSACTMADAPVCDGSAHACRGCVADSECTSGICLESNGTCADASAAVFAIAGGSDTGSCTQAAPCGTLVYASEQMSGTKNVLKILGNQYDITTTQSLGITGYVDGSSTAITGNGSDGMIEIKFGNVVFTGVTLSAIDDKEANILGGQATFYGDTIGGTITVNGGTLTLDHAVATNLDCGVGFSGPASVPGTLNISQSQFLTLEARSCPISMQQSTIDETSTPNFAGFAIDIEGSGGSFHIENNVIVSVNPNAFGAALEGSAGNTFRFNTLVNLSGEDQMAEALNCQTGGPYDVSNNIVAWHTSLVFACPVTYSLVDSLEGVPPGAGNLVGDASTFFIDMANKNFHLASGSPAIGTGSGGADVTVDHDGDPRPNPAGSRPDIGAFEAP